MKKYPDGTTLIEISGPIQSEGNRLAWIDNKNFPLLFLICLVSCLGNTAQDAKNLVPLTIYMNNAGVSSIHEKENHDAIISGEDNDPIDADDGKFGFLFLTLYKSQLPHLIYVLCFKL